MQKIEVTFVLGLNMKVVINKAKVWVKTCLIYIYIFTSVIAFNRYRWKDKDAEKKADVILCTIYAV